MHTHFIRLVIAGFIFSIFFATNAAPLKNPELEKMRNQLPEKALTVDLVLALAARYSDSFQTVRAEAYNIDLPKLKAEARFDTQIEASQTWQHNQNRPNNDFSPDDSKGNAFSLGASRYFSSGTGVALELSQGYNKILFPTGSPIVISPYWETQASIELSQNLWADSFGYASRRALRAARLASDGQKLQFRSTVETWALNIVGSFYSAWFSQAQALAAQEDLTRRERLLTATRRRLNRGTAEEPDFLQVESSYLLSKTRLLEANKTLDDQWRRLVFSLKLPAQWLEVEATDVPLKIDEVVADAQLACQQFRQKGIPPGEPAALGAARLFMESAELSWESAKSLARPDLKLVGSYFLNGLDFNQDRGESASEAFGADNPGWAVGLTLTLPLEFSAQKAAVHESTAQRIKALALRNDAKDDYALTWLNECANLERLVITFKTAKEAHANQKRRTVLEERRFRLGRSSTLSVIQAGDDATASEIFLNSTQVQLRQSAWQIFELNSQIIPKLQQFAERHGQALQLE